MKTDSTGIDWPIIRLELARAICDTLISIEHETSKRIYADKGQQLQAMINTWNALDDLIQKAERNNPAISPSLKHTPRE